MGIVFGKTMKWFQANIYIHLVSKIFPIMFKVEAALSVWKINLINKLFLLCLPEFKGFGTQFFTLTIIIICCY